MLEIIGHAEILSAFDRLVRNGRLAHAYLLTGPAGVGKTAIATWLASRLLCTAAGEYHPCGRCDTCMHVVRNAHPDVLRLFGDDVGTVERVREWTAALSRSSLFGGWKIGIVEDAEHMNEASANACLKSIEEPPPRTVVLLNAPSARAVLPTIASRCARIRCNRVPMAEIQTALRARGVRAGESEEIAAASGGCPGRAIAFADAPERRRAHAQRSERARSLLSGPFVDRFRAIDALLRPVSGDRSAAEAIALELVAAMRERAQATDVAQRAQREWVRWQDLLARAPAYLHANVHPRALLDTLVLTYPTV